MEKNHREKTNNNSIRTYVNKIENILHLKKRSRNFNACNYEITWKHLK